MNNQTIKTLTATALFLSIFALPAFAQEESLSFSYGDDNIAAEISASTPRDILTQQTTSFDSKINNPSGATIQEIVWDFGDGIRATGSRVNHTYNRPGNYLVKLRVTTDNGTTTENTTEVHVFSHLIVLVSDNSASSDKIERLKTKAANEGTLLYNIRAKDNIPEVLIEEDLTSQLLDIRPTLNQAHLVVVWTSGGVGANVLTKFAQHIKQAENVSQGGANLSATGITLLSDTPFAVLAPTAQSAFDQLQPKYIILTRPQIIDAIAVTTTADQAKSAILASSVEHRIFGPFSARTVSDLGITNFMSFGISFLINRGVPINSIILILMLPIIATILAFARQVIGIKSFGLVTPAMTTLSFLVMGLQHGLIVFTVIVLSGTITRSILRRLRLLYLPRMALVLTSVSLSLLLLLAIGVASNQSTALSFSIFPALILTILAEEFIAAQFKLGVRSALTLTAWTLVLSTVCYLTVSSDVFRTLVLSYPEIILLTIPVNIALGQWSGLRITEYFRFRAILRYAKLIS